MKKIFLSVSLLCLVSCKSIHHSDYQLNIDINKKLPTLEAVINISNLETIFSSGGIVASGNNMGSQIGNNGWVQTGTITTSSFKDKRVQDTITIFDDFVKNKVTNPYDTPEGYIALTIGYRNYLENVKNLPLIVLSFCSLGTLNLLGMPVAENTEEMKVSIEVLDKDKHLIKKYDSYQSDSEWIAIWGYNAPISNQKISIENIKNGLNEIGQKINQDAEEIKKKLKK